MKKRRKKQHRNIATAVQVFCFPGLGRYYSVVRIRGKMTYKKKANKVTKLSVQCFEISLTFFYAGCSFRQFFQHGKDHTISGKSTLEQLKNRILLQFQTFFNACPKSNREFVAECQTGVTLPNEGSITRKTMLDTCISYSL